jgi:hypothetical protein
MLEELRAGRFVVMVLAPKREARIIAADILNAHGAELSVVPNVASLQGQTTWVPLRYPPAG